MRKNVHKRRRRRNRKGQGISEYGAVIAFVAFLCALTFSLAKGSLSGAVQGSFSSVAGQLNNMSSASSSAS